ncbi:MAG TPA: hypothetical protein VKB86_17680 [Pyrinomonadaceae bacterium]|nr:hypothetical protein [Pyrinomonadaceae bacterium]
MVKWFTSLILTLVLAGSAFAGVPMHLGEKHCPIMGTDDCCEKAESQSTTPQAYAARLCCSLNCNVPGTTSQAGIVLRVPSPTVSAAAIIPATHVILKRDLATNLTPERNQHSPPIYLQHLALLI